VDRFSLVALVTIWAQAELAEFFIFAGSYAHGPAGGAGF
jgi:hypothetical protein